MVRSLSLVLVFPLAAFGQLPGEDAAPAQSAGSFEPTTYDISRYQNIWNKSPFEFEIVVPVEEEIEDTTFDDLQLSGYSDRGT